MARNEQGKAVLPLIEMTIALSVLAVCSVITVSLFLYAHFAGEASRDMNQALLLAQSQGELLHTMENIQQKSTVGYNAQWQEEKNAPVFLMNITLEKEPGENASLYSGEITVERIKKYPFLSADRKKLAKLSISVFCTEEKGAGV